MAKVIKYTPKSAASAWADDALQLSTLGADEAIVIEGDKGARVAFQRAARELDFTARCVNTEVITESSGVNAKGEAVDTSVYEFTFIKSELRVRDTKADEAEDAEVADAE